MGTRERAALTVQGITADDTDNKPVYNWRGKFAAPTGQHKLPIKTFTAAPTTAQIRYYKRLGGTENVNHICRGDLSNMIAALGKGRRVDPPARASGPAASIQDSKPPQAWAMVSRFYDDEDEEEEDDVIATARNEAEAALF